MTEERRYPAFATPRGVFKAVHLTEPDFGNEKFPKPDGEYSVTVLYRANDPAVIAFLAALNPLHEEALETARAAAREALKKLPAHAHKAFGDVVNNDLFRTVFDRETEEPTGEIEFKFTMRAGGAVRQGPKKCMAWRARPDIFDAKGSLVLKVPAIGAGTEGRIAIEASPYFIPITRVAGLMLRLKAVQIIKLVSAGARRSASSYGFGEEDGYVYAGGS